MDLAVRFVVHDEDVEEGMLRGCGSRCLGTAASLGFSVSDSRQLEYDPHGSAG